MVINIDKDSLLKSINIAESIISTKNINTILSNCLFNISSNEIEIISTDNEIAVRTKIDASSDVSRSFTANGKKFSSILRELPDDVLEIHVDDSLLIDIKTKSKDIKGHYTLIGAEADEYPTIPEFTDDDAIEIEQKLLKDMIKKVIYSASHDTIKPVFNGLYFITESDGRVSSVATDSRRLTLISRDIKDSSIFSDGMIIPLKTVNEVLRLLDTSGNCKFSVNKNQCFFKISNTEIISRVVDGQFPNYKQVVPKETILDVTIETKKFLDSIRRAMIFTREPANKIILHFEKNKIIIEANTPDLGQAEEEIQVKSSNAEKISIGINAQFLIDSLKEIDSDIIVCGITGQMSPVTIMPENDSNYVAVIMPIQIKSSHGE